MSDENRINVATAEEFLSAVSNPQGVVTLTEDLTLNVAEITKSCDIDLNGKTITAEAKTALKIFSNGVVVNLNGETEGSKVHGTIIVGWRDGDGCTLNIKGGDYEASVADQPAVQTNGLCQNVTLTCENASFESTDDTFYIAGGGAVTLKNCEVYGATGIYAKGSKITLIGTAVSADGEAAEPQPNGNGASSTGDGIIIDAKNGYTGNVELVVDKDSMVLSQNRNAICETYTDAQATVARKIEVAGFVSGPVSASQFFKTALDNGNATVNFEGAQFTAEVSPNLLPEGVAMYKQADGTYRALDADTGTFETFFGTEAEITQLKAQVDAIELNPVCTSDKVKEVQKILQDLNTTEMMKGDRSVGKSVILKTFEILKKATAEELSLEEIESLRSKALEVFFLLYRVVETAGQMK